MRGVHAAVGWRSLAIVVPVWALIAPGFCAAVCGSRHCEGPADRIESHALHDAGHLDQAEPCASERAVDRGVASAESPHETAICRCDEVASLSPKVVDTGSAVSGNAMAVALPAPSPLAVHLRREVFDLPVHPFPSTNPPLLL